MGVPQVQAALAATGFDGEVREFAESSATVALAAEQVGTSPERIAKTIALTDPGDPDRAILVVIAGDARIHGGRFKRTFGGKPRMLPHDQVEPMTGHPVGGVCPFANPDSARVFLDASLQRFVSVFPAAGSATSAVEVRVDALMELAGAEDWVEVTSGWQTVDPPH